MRVPTFSQVSAKGKTSKNNQVLSEQVSPSSLREGGILGGGKKGGSDWCVFPTFLSGFHLFLILGFGISFIHLFSYGGRCFSAGWGVLRAELLFLLSPCGSGSSILGHALPSADGAGMRQLLESGAGKPGEGGKCAYPAFLNLVHSLGRCQTEWRGLQTSFSILEVRLCMSSTENQIFVCLFLLCWWFFWGFFCQRMRRN